jgi:hypothetical protein
MQPMSETSHTEALWEKCRRRGLRLQVVRCDNTANGHTDKFVVRILHPQSSASVCEVRTTNIESAATLILDRYEKDLNG